MKRKKSGSLFPRPLLKSLASDITLLMTSNEGRLLAMEIVDELPYEVRPLMLESLSAFFRPEMLQFFHLVKVEFGPELKAECERALGKLTLAGVIPTPDTVSPRVFYRALASRTRHLGQVKLEVAYLKPLEMTLEVECFTLAFNSDGIYFFYLLPDMPLEDFEREHSGRDDLVEVSEKEVSCLVREAYRQNEIYMTPPALGRFLYNKYLQAPGLATSRAKQALSRRLIPDLPPRELVHSFLYASRYGDLGFMSAVCLQGEDAYSDLPELTSESQLLMEGRVVREVQEGNMAMLFVTTSTVRDEEVYRSEYIFTLVKKGSRWVIEHINRYRHQHLSENSPDNPFSRPVYCGVHHLEDVDDLFAALEHFDDVREIGELPFGSHLRIIREENDRQHGVSFMTGILADIVINGEEVVVITDEEKTMRMVGETLARGGGCTPLDEHVVEIVTAYGYVSGSYMSFEQAMNRDPDLNLDDNMKFITIRYLTSDRQRVLDKLSALPGRRFTLPDCEAVYRLECVEGQELLLAEFLVGEGWVTVSAFGDTELARQRTWFEEGLRPTLEFDGVQLREDGLLGILDPETTKAVPELKPFLKEIYLNRWYRVKHTQLNGMTPSEAEQSPEGRQLLWLLVKEMRKRQKRGSGGWLDWKDYISRVDLGT